MNELSPADRRALRARAHHLHPVVHIGTQGLTPAVLHEIDVALGAHELVKIRVHEDDRAARGELLARVCVELAAAPVQHVGKLLIVFRRKPDDAAAPEKPRRRAPKKKVSGTTPRKPRARHTGGKGKPEPSRHATAPHAAGRRSGARGGLTRKGAGVRSSKFAPGMPPAPDPQAPRRRRRTVVVPAAKASGAKSAPSVRRRRKNP